jgi:hypothetical protein
VEEETEPTGKGTDMGVWVPVEFERWVTEEVIAAMRAGMKRPSASRVLRYLIALGQDHYTREGFFAAHGIEEEGG